MLEVIFLTWAGLAVVITLLFLVSTKDLEKLSRMVDRPITIPQEAQMGKLVELLNREINLNRSIIKYRIPIAVASFLAAVFLLSTAIYVVSF